MKHFHFIGICGKGIGPVAKMMADRGFRVTGSDKGIYDPMKSYLEKTGIEFWVGWNPERMGKPDAIVLTYAAPLSSPEVIRARELGIPEYSWAEIVEQYLVKKESIVVVGNAGKTTTTALIAWIFEQAGRNPSFMIGDWVSEEMFPNPTRYTDSEWSVIEGDEFPAAKEGGARKSKIFFYHPKYLVLTGIEWDHVDIFPTREAYVQNFLDVLLKIPEDGCIIANAEGAGIDELLSRCKEMRKDRMPRVVYYGTREKHPGQYWYSDVAAHDALRTLGGVDFVFSQGQDLSGDLALPKMVGTYNAENASAAAALCLECGIDFPTIDAALLSFVGIRRRMEERFNDGARVLYDDFAHNELKFKNAIGSLREHYPTEKIIIIPEPNAGNRLEDAIPDFAGVFTKANLVIVPRFGLTTLPGVVDGKRFAEVIANDTRVEYIEDDEQLVKKIIDETHGGGVIAFMGSHGFRGMIDMTQKALAGMTTANEQSYRDGTVDAFENNSRTYITRGGVEHVSKLDG